MILCLFISVRTWANIRSQANCFPTQNVICGSDSQHILMYDFESFFFLGVHVTGIKA